MTKDAGLIYSSTRRIDIAFLRSLRFDDVVDDPDALIEKIDGQMRVLKADRIPTQTGVAATFRQLNGIFIYKRSAP